MQGAVCTHEILSNNNAYLKLLKPALFNKCIAGIIIQ